MRPLETNRRVLTWLCLHPADEVVDAKFNFFYVTLTCVDLLMTFIFLISGLFLLLEFKSIDLKIAFFAIWQICGGFQMLYTFTALFLSRKEMKSVFEKLSEFYQANKSDDSFGFLIETNATCEWMWSLYFKYTAANVINMLAACGGSMLYCCMLNGSFDAEKVLHPCRLVLPWNQTTPVGYLGEICFDGVIIIALLIPNGAVLLLFLSVCLHHCAFSKMFRHSVQKLNHSKNHRNGKELLSNLIRFNVSVKDWFNETASLFSPNFAIILISYTLCFASVVLRFDALFGHFDFDMCIIFEAIVVIIVNVFAYCYFGRLATESLARMTDDLYEVNWHELPIGLQKYLVVMIENMQRPLLYHGFGVAVINLQTFSKWINTVFKYYMIFKSLTNE